MKQMDFNDLRYQYDCLHEISYGSQDINGVDPLLKSKTMLNGYLLVDRIFQHIHDYDQILESNNIIILDKNLFYKNVDRYFDKRSMFDLMELKVLLRIVDEDKMQMVKKILENMFGFDVLLSDNKIEIKVKTN